MKKWTRYIGAFVITTLLFGSAFLLSNYLNNKKLGSVQSIQDSLSIDILSSETEFSLLSELACKDVENSIIAKELGELEERIDYADKNLHSPNEVIKLKKFYSLLEIKDYLLYKQIVEKCNTDTISILYFYTNNGSCDDCEKQGYALTSLRSQYPNLRVYSFDYQLDLSATRALISIFKVKDTELPVIVIGDDLYNGFQSALDIKNHLPQLKEIDIQTETNVGDSTTTNQTTKQ